MTSISNPWALQRKILMNNKEIILRCILRALSKSDSLSLEIMSAALGVLESNHEFPIVSLEVNNGCQEDYDRGRMLGTSLRGGVDYEKEE